MGENLEVVWVEFSTLSPKVLLIVTKLHSLQMATSKIESSAQVLSCKLKFVHDSSLILVKAVAVSLEQTLNFFSKVILILCHLGPKLKRLPTCARSTTSL